MIWLKLDNESRVICFSDTKVTGFTAYEGILPEHGEDESLYYVDGVVVAKKPEASKAEQEARRASAYRERVDPLTAEITRKESDLQREIVPPEDRAKVMARIDAAYAERDAAVADIDAKYPYPKE